MTKPEVFYGTFWAWIVALALVGCFWAYPNWSVYSNRLAGEGELARAEAGRQVMVRAATAKRDAAVMEAEAEVNRAKGVAEANKIIGASLQGNEGYLRYLWIQTLEDSKGKTVVYVPTEANLPILEATRKAGQ